MDQDPGTSTLTVAERLCNSCGRSKPIQEFRFKNRATGLRHGECNGCAAAQRRGSRTGKRRQEIQKYLEQASDASDPRNYGCTTRTEAIVRAMMMRFGGLDQFVGFWFEFIQHARDSGKEHLVQRSLETMAHFIGATDKNQSAQRSAGEMPNEQARGLIMEHVVRAIFEDPDLAAQILGELGWRVEPPEDPTEEPFGPFRQRVEAKITASESGSLQT